MLPLIHEILSFLRYLLTPETEVAAMRYDGAAAGAAKAGLWVLLAIAAGMLLARMLGGGV